MEKKEIEELIEKKVLEAKLQASETRLQLVLWLGAILITLLGVVVPIWQTNTSTEKVDKAIEAMENRFKELAGTQLQRPELECYINSNKLEGSVLSFTPDQSRILELRNLGDGPARNIKIRLYINDKQKLDDYGIQYDWQFLELNDEPEFSKAFEFRQSIDYLDPKNSIPLQFGIQTLKGEPLQTSALLKIYYGQPEPKKVLFSVDVKSR